MARCFTEGVFAYAGIAGMSKLTAAFNANVGALTKFTQVFEKFTQVFLLLAFIAVLHVLHLSPPLASSPLLLIAGVVIVQPFLPSFLQQDLDSIGLKFRRSV